MGDFVIGPVLEQAVVYFGYGIWVIVITNIVIMLVLLVPRLVPRREH